MADALRDLEVFMVKSGTGMVHLAQDLNDRLSATSSSSLCSSSISSEPEGAKLVQCSLSQLGLQMANTSMMLDMAKGIM